MTKRFHHIFMALTVILVLVSCRKTAYQIVYPSLNDGRYDSEFPYRNSSEELEKISGSVKKLYCLVEYDRYHFDAVQEITAKVAADQRLRRIASHKGFFSESVHGSATIIMNENNQIVVLTCAHIIDYPDTIFSFYTDQNNQNTEFLESISVKKKQNNFIRDLPGNGDLEIIYMDSELDLAFLGNTFDNLNEFKIPVFSYPVGEPGELEWGSFVYIMGYPGGHQMVTRGIVSNPKPNRKGEFIIDALFNQGISGGIVLAIRDGVPNFELVGIAKSVSAKYKNVIKPAHESHQELYNPNIPYTGELFVKVEKEINYGVTFIVSTETIRNQYLLNRHLFISRGYNLDGFFTKSK